MSRVRLALDVVLALVVLAAGGAAVARADEPIATASFVRLGEHGDAAVLSGYDTASGNLVVRASGEASLRHGLALRAGFEARTLPDDQRPFAGLRARVLDEAADGVEGWLGLVYEQDGIRPGEGRLEASAWLAKGGLRAQLAYAQDEENDDRQADVQLAALHTFTPRFAAGLGGRLRSDLWSDDPKRRAGEPDLELVVGPLAEASAGAFVVFGQLGLSAVRVERVELGVLAVGGVGAIF